MADSTVRVGELLTFLRRRDYTLVKELGQGSCGQTVLLHDPQIDEHFVCKKYVPPSEAHRQELFTNFVREIKLLHQVHHKNCVRVFNYYVYPEHHAGFILMEYVDGANIDDFLATDPELTNEVFLQAISGFAHLESAGILHRDIRPGNLMVRPDGTLKIIDLGFGKQIDTSDDFDKSITLNWWCDPPEEFQSSRYDFQTEVYFVGKLFQKLIQENEITGFKFSELLRRMCAYERESRIQSFSELEKLVRSEQFDEIEFDDWEYQAYQRFSKAIRKQFVWISQGATYFTDIQRIQTRLNEVHRNCMLEPTVPNAKTVLSCFIDGGYRFNVGGMPVGAVTDFVALLKRSSDEKKRIILGNLQTTLDTVTRFTKAEEPPEDDIPF